MEAAGSLVVGADLAGCRVERLLGRGGMGEVYLARQLVFARPVALKVLAPEHAGDALYRDKFFLEARAAAVVEHPNVVAVYDAGEERGRLFLVMQYVRGGDLATHTAGRRLAPLEVASVGIDVARALAAMWAEGVVHLDIKPANVLRSDRGEWKVTDFGIARLSVPREGGAAAQPSGDSSGTPAYMAPEQWMGEAVDGRTDLHALGVMLYQLLSGRLPYDVPPGAPPLAWLAALSTSEPAPLATVAPAAPPPLARLVERLIAKEPDGRPPSASAVAAELEDFAARERLGAGAARSGAEIASAGAAPPAAAARARPSEPERPLEGREPELARFAAACASARGGTGRLLVVEGPRGSGRSRLLEEMGRRAAREGARVLAARARGDSPLSVPRQILSALFGLDEARDDASRRARLRDGLALAVGAGGIARALDSLEPLLLGGKTRGPGARADLPPAQLAGIVAAGASASGLGVVLVDDLDAADRATVVFVLALAERVAEARLALVVALGDGAEAARIGASLGVLAAAERVALAGAARGDRPPTPPSRPLPAAPAADRVAEAEGLLARALGARAFHDHAGAIEELERALGLLDRDAPAALAARLRRELARTLRAAGARLADAVELAREAAATSRRARDPRGAAEGALEEGLALHLLKRYGDALRAFDEGAADLAAAPAPAADAVQARRLGAELAHARGLALSRLPGRESAAAAAGAFHAGLHEAAAAGDQDLYARIAQSIGDAAWRASDIATAEQYLRLSAWYKERLGDLAGLAIAYGSLGRVAESRGEREEAIAWYERDLAIAKRIGDHRGIGVAANSVSEHYEARLRATGDRGALELAERALATARAAADRSKNELDDAICWLYHGRFLCRSRGETARGVRELEHALAFFRARGHAALAAEAEEALAAARSG